MTKWAVKQIYSDSGHVRIIGPTRVKDATTDMVTEKENHDVYVDVFDTKEDAEVFIRDELQEE